MAATTTVSRIKRTYRRTLVRGRLVYRAVRAFCKEAGTLSAAVAVFALLPVFSAAALAFVSISVFIPRRQARNYRTGASHA